MSISDRIQLLRKARGISQEQLADQIGVSRQAVSKWESEQSVPDLEKIILLSNYFEITTDYLLKGIEPKLDKEKKRSDARIYTVVSTVLNVIGLIAALVSWREQQTTVAVLIGLMISVIGCAFFAVGQLIGEKKKSAAFWFWVINIWFVSFIPIALACNLYEGFVGRFSPWIAPIICRGNSIQRYFLYWFLYFVINMVGVIIALIKRKRSRI